MLHAASTPLVSMVSSSCVQFLKLHDVLHEGFLLPSLGAVPSGVVVRLEHRGMSRHSIRVLFNPLRLELSFIPDVPCDHYYSLADVTLNTSDWSESRCPTGWEMHISGEESTGQLGGLPCRVSQS